MTTGQSDIIPALNKSKPHHSVSVDQSIRKQYPGALWCIIVLSAIVFKRVTGIYVYSETKYSNKLYIAV